MQHLTGWDTICLIAILIFSAYITKLIIGHGAAAARVAELEAERDALRPALHMIATGAGADIRRYAAVLDAQWPGWRTMATGYEATLQGDDRA